MAQQDLTHTVALLCATSLFLFGFFRTLERPSLLSYLVLGIATGIGVISKYNFALMPFIAIAAAIPDREWRRRIFDWRILPALVIALAITLPHLLWLYQNMEVASAGTLSKMVDGREADDAFQAGERVDKALESVQKDIDVLVRNINPLTSIDQVKSAASSLLNDATGLQANAKRLQDKFWGDYKSLTNVKDGTMRGSNYPPFRAAMMYGQDKHKEMTCPEPFRKEVELSSGLRADCVSFAKDNCAVYEFKPDKNFTESSAAGAEKKYLQGITEYYREKDKDLAKDCKKDANGNPVFEPKGKVYPACRPSSF